MPVATDPAAATYLNAAQIQFLRQPVAINVASRDRLLTPSVARARVLLQDLGGGPIAVLFTPPQTHQALQLKAPRAEVRLLGPDDRERMQAYGVAIHAELMSVDSGEVFCSAFVLAVHEEVVALEFTPVECFEQTPGPDAGKRPDSSP